MSGSTSQRRIDRIAERREQRRQQQRAEQRISATELRRRRESRRDTARSATPVRDVVAVVILLLICAVPLWPMYRHPFVAVTVAGAVVLGTAGAIVGVRFRLPWYSRVVILMAVALIAGPALAVARGTLAGVVPTLEGLARFSTGVVTGWSDIISVDLPLGDYDAVLVPAFVVLLAAVAVGVGQALRGRRWPALIAALGVLSFGVAFGPEDPFLPIVVGGSAVVWSLLWMILVKPRLEGVTAKHSARLRRGQLRRGGVAVAFVLVCTAAGGAIVQAAPPENRAVLRTAFAPPFEPNRQDSPLQAYRASVSEPAAEQSLASVTGLPSGTMLRLSVLDDYNGVAFTIGDPTASPSTGSFAVVPYLIDRSAESAERTTVQIDVHSDLGMLLPTAGGVEQFMLPDGAQDSVYYNRDLDSAVRTEGVTDGLSYSVTGLVPQPARTDGLAQLQPGTAAQTELVKIPQQLIDDAARSWDVAQAPGAQLQSALDYLHAGYVSHSGEGEVFSRSGHSVARLDLLATEDPMLGDAEQYAAAFAVLAREIGFPSRVVLGLVDANDDGDLTGSELTAWVEVNTANGEWIAVDPNPEPREVPEEERTTSDAIAPPRTVIPPEPPTQQHAITPCADESDVEDRAEPPAWQVILSAVWWWTWRVGSVLAVLTAPLWGVLLAEAIRRRLRRRRDREALAATGVWREARDEIIDSGAQVSPTATRLEIAGASGSEQAALLAQRVDRSVFGRGELSREQVDTLWATLPAVRSELREGRTRWQRFRARVSPRSLFSAWRR
ncbi:MAG: transglutaminaseTgpA domain-containing protein [Mycetocola sp.]